MQISEEWGPHLDPQVRHTDLEPLLEFVKLDGGSRHQRRFLQEDARFGKGHHVQEGGQLPAGWKLDVLSRTGS